MHIAYCGITLKVVLIKVTIMRYKIKHAEQIAHFANNDFSEGIGCPSKAVLTFMRLKVYQELNFFFNSFRDPNLPYCDHEQIAQ